MTIDFHACVLAPVNFHFVGHFNLLERVRPMVQILGFSEAHYHMQYINVIAL